jgi:predicted transcriptional regulator of viral defense system
MAESPSISDKGRFRLSLVIREAGNLVSIDDVSATLGLNRIDAAKLLSRWQKQGWVKRLRRGIYAPVPLTAFG